MTHEEVMKKLTEIFRDVFDDDELNLTGATSANDIEDWDSLAQVTLMASIEQEFRIRLDMQELRRLGRVADMVEIILLKTNSKN